MINNMLVAGASRARIGWLKGVSIALSVVLALPIFVVLSHVFLGDLSVWQHLANTVLWDYVQNSLILMVGVALGVLLLGVPTAWLTSVCEFPGRRWFAWILLLPLAVPAYIIAYTYTGVLDYAGPVQSLIRQWTGLGYGEYWFFNIRSLGGAVIMLVLVLYPYVYLMARTAFLEQSSNTLEVSRTLGYNHKQSFFKLGLPLARPAIVAGLTLALMETLADYGTVQYFGVSTFTTGIFRTFYGFGESAAASQLAAILLLFVSVLIMAERYSRRKIKYHTSSLHKASQRKIPLHGWRGALAFTVCLVPVVLGFVLPFGQLLYWSIFESIGFDQGFLELAWNSLYLAATAAVIAVFFALILAYANRLYQSKVVASAVSVAGLGYALPGTIIAIGVIIPFAWMDHRVIDWSKALLDVNPGLLFSGTLFALLFAYTVRFMAVSLGAVQSGLGKIKPSFDMAGRSMGLSPLQVLQRIHFPLLRGAVLTALLIVFVDVLKELPATLVLRPFNFNTLAVRAFELASDERLADAAPASIMIVLVGLLPVILLSRSITPHH